MSSTKIIAIQQNRRVRLSQSFTRPSNATQYAAGDVVSEITTNDHYTFEGMSRSGEQTGIIETAICISSTPEATPPDLELWLFQKDIADVADNTAFAPTDANIADLIGIIDFPTGTWVVGKVGTGGTGNALCTITDIQIPFQTIDGKDNRSIFGQLVVRNTYTPISGEIFTVILNIIQD